MAVAFQPVAFEPPSVYEAPSLLINQILDDEVTLAGIHHDLFDQNRLSPAERDGLTQRLKSKFGDHSITNAVIDIATNPLVWLMFLSQPVARSSHLAGKSVYSGSRKFGAFVREHHSALASFDTLQEDLQGTGLGSILHEAVRIRQDVQLKDIEHFQSAVDKFKAANKITSLDVTKLKDLRQRRLVEDVHSAMEIRANRLGEDVVVRFPKAALKDDRFELAFEEVTQPALVDGYEQADRVLNETPGARELFDAVYHPETGFYRKAHKLLFEDEAGAIDPKKVSRFWRGRTQAAVGGELAPTWHDALSTDDWAVGMDILDQLHGPTVSEALRRGAIKEDQFLALVKNAHEASIAHGHYVPRNLPVFHNPQAVPLKDIYGTNRVRSGGYGVLRSTGPSWHPESLARYRRFGATDALEAEIAAGEATLAGDSFAVLHKIDHWESLRKYRHKYGTDYAMYVSPVRPEHLANLRNSMGLAPELEKKALAEPIGGLSNVDLVAIGHRFMKDRTTARSLRDVWLPAVTNSLVTAPGMLTPTVLKVQDNWRRMVESSWFQKLRGAGDWGASFVDAAERMGASEVTPQKARSLADWTAKWLYRSHLGLNMGAVMLNATQPWLHAHGYLGTQAVVHGYGQMFKEMGAYIQGRWKLGRNISEAAHAELIKKTFRHENFYGESLLGLSRDPFNAIDQQLFSGGEKGTWERIGDMMLAPFQYAEWSNRIVTAHAAEYAASARGFTDKVGVAEEVRRFVNQTQFGGGPENTPRMFLHPDSIGSNPLVRQFQQFPMRSFSQTFRGPGRLGEGKRLLRGTDQELPGPAALWDGLRLLGTSAIAYEVGKNLLGVDPLRGGIVAASNPFGERALGEEDPINLPPIAQIPWDMFRSYASGDAALMSMTIPRLVPGGLALSKAMGVLPEMPRSVLAGLPGSMQKRYADWGHATPDGMVPVFQGDGSLIEYRSPTALVLEGLGIDLQNHKRGSDIDGYLAKNREEIIEYRQRAMAKLLANDVAGAQAVQAEFQKRFGVPLTVSQTQIKAAIRQREVPRSERMLDGMPPEVRRQYQEIVATRARNQGLTKTAIIEAETSRRRSEIVKRPETVTLDAATLRTLKEMAIKAEQEKKIRAMAFAPFKSFQVKDPYTGLPVGTPPPQQKASSD